MAGSPHNFGHTFLTIKYSSKCIYVVWNKTKEIAESGSLILNVLQIFLILRLLTWSTEETR